jgi:hypothetical protein
MGKALGEVHTLIGLRNLSTKRILSYIEGVHYTNEYAMRISRQGHSPNHNLSKNDAI